MSDVNIKITIVMPSLNVASYIEESVRSVMNQTLREIEILCIDAGSTDGTLDILNSLSKEDGRIRIIQSAMKSYGYQVNVGIHEAKGKYISIIETDDFICNDMLATLYGAAIQADADIVKSDYQAYWTTDEGKRFLLYRHVSSNKELYGKVFCPKDYDTVPIDDWYLWNGIYKKKFLINNNIVLSESAGAAFQDIGFLCQVNHYLPETMYIPTAYYYYCIDRTDSSSNSGKGLIFARHEYERILEEKVCWETKDIYIRMAKSFFSCMREISDLSMQSKEFIDAFYWFKEKLNNAIAMKIVGEDNLPSHMLEIIKELITSIDKFQDLLKARKKSMLDKLNLSASGGILIFGCGDYGHKAYVKLKKMNYNICGFIDNNASLRSIKIDNLPIYSAEDAFLKYGDTILYMVANEIYYDVIVKQLINLGIKNEQICVYSN